MFEKFGCPALYLAKNAVLSAFATAKQTALVVDTGHASTTGGALGLGGDGGVLAVHTGRVQQPEVGREVREWG